MFRYGLSKKLISKQKTFCHHTRERITALFLGKTTYIRKGIYFRKLTISPHTKGLHLGEFLISKKPVPRTLGTKRR